MQNTCNASIESKGFCFYKTTNGIKRHLAVDTLGFPFFTHCTSANLSDDAGLIEMLTHNIDYFQSKPVNIPKLTLLLDHGYHPEHLTQELEKVYPQILRKIKFELSTKPDTQEKAVIAKVWICSSSRAVGEASAPMLGWSDVKSWSRTLKEPTANATTKLNLCNVQLMIKRLAAFYRYQMGSIRV